MASIVRLTLDAFRDLNAARENFHETRTPANLIALIRAESRFNRSNRSLALAAVEADLESLAA